MKKFHKFFGTYLTMLELEKLIAEHSLVRSSIQISCGDWGEGDIRDLNEFKRRRKVFDSRYARHKELDQFREDAHYEVARAYEEAAFLLEKALQDSEMIEAVEEIHCEE